MKSRHHDPARWLTPSTALLTAALIGFGTRSLWPRAAGQTPTDPAVPVSTAQVVRTDVAQRQVVSGTLDYRGSFSVVNELPAGVLTWLPGPGQVINRGHDLYRLANQAAILLYGPVPAWRDFSPWMTPGPDVRELNANLDALGFGAGPPGDTFTWATEAAIERWQLARGLPETGTIPLGAVVFLPGPLRITTAAMSTGDDTAPGSQVLTGTSTEPSVSVGLTPGGPAVRPGDGVQVTMPDGTTTVPGTVATVGAATAVQGSGGNAGTQGSGNTGSAGDGSTPATVIPVVIRLGGYPSQLDRASVQVAITEKEERNVLAVPVTALIAQPGGGYAVRTAGTPHRLIPVAIGLYDDETSLIEVSGPGLAAGLRVQAGQG